MGRPKGSPNKTTAAVKDAMIAVYADLQAEAEEGGDNAHFKAWAKGNATEFYKLWSKMLPTEVKAEIEGDINGRLIWEWPKT